jgi:CheY-like chemotaxis protein
MAQVIANLLSNALKFSERGKSVRVSVDRDEAGRSAVLAVRDEGAGIDPALVERIFDPFVQGETSLARSRGGLGLGLAVAKGLVDLHGGRISAHSGGVGRGAALRVELPLVDARTALAAPVDELYQATGAGTANVLVFEDNADAAESLEAILSYAGYRVRVESTGRDAMQLVRSTRPDAVLCDLGLPDRDGYAVASEIRSDHEWSWLPLIAITGYGALDDQSRSRRAGFDVHLTKPVPPAQLLSELSRRIQSRPDASAARRA